MGTVGILLISVGIVCILAAIVGGGLKALNVELPAFHRPVQHALFALIGVSLFGLGLWFVNYTPVGSPDGITAHLDPIGDVRGACPGYVRVSGSITIAEGRGPVRYHGVITSIDGTTTYGSEDSVFLPSPGTAATADTIPFNGSFSGYYMLEVEDPVVKDSEQVPFSVSCAGY